MKKVMFLMAVAGMFAFAACNNNTPAEEENVDTPVAVEEMAQEVPADTIPADTAATVAE